MLTPGTDRHVVVLEDGEEIGARAVLLATGAQYRRLPVDDLADYEGMCVFYAAGPPEAQVCGASRVAVVGGGNSAGQAAVWLSRGGALVTLLHRRADLRETMSDPQRRERLRERIAYFVSISDELLGRWASVMLSADVYAEIVDRHVELVGDLAWMGSLFDHLKPRDHAARARSGAIPPFRSKASSATTSSPAGSSRARSSPPSSTARRLRWRCDSCPSSGGPTVLGRVTRP